MCGFPNRNRIFSGGEGTENRMAVASPAELVTPQSSRRERGQLRTIEELQGVKMTGAQITCAALEAEGVDIVFGYPGGAVIPLYDAIARSNCITCWSASSSGPRWRPMAMRGQLARSVSAWRHPVRVPRTWLRGLPMPNSTPCQWSRLPDRSPKPLIGGDAFQESDITGITLPVTKHNYLVQRSKTSPRRSRKRSTSPSPVALARFWSTSRRTCSRRRPNMRPVD